jgi:hypothetical protein
MGVLSEGWNLAVRGGLAIALKAEPAKIKPPIHTARRQLIGAVDAATMRRVDEALLVSLGLVEF